MISTSSSRGEQREELRVVGHPRAAAGLDRVDGERERHLAVAVVMAVALSIRRDVHELRRGVVMEAAHETLGEPLAAVEEALERHPARSGGIVEEHRDRPSRREAAVVRAPRVDPVSDVVPLARPCANPLRLVRSEDRETDPFVGHQIQRLEIHRRLGEPHPLGAPAEALFEIARAPPDLRLLVAPRGERHDHVVVRLRQRRAVPAEAARAVPVPVQDRLVRLRRLLFHPGEQRRSEIEAHPRVVVDDLRDPPTAVEDARRAVRRVALRRDLLVPVVVRDRRFLKLDGFEPRVLARGLVEVAVNADVSHRTAGSSTHAAKEWGAKDIAPASRSWGRASAPGPSHLGSAVSMTRRRRLSSGSIKSAPAA